MKQPVRVDVAGVEHQLNRSPADVAAAQPHERAQPVRQLAKIEHVARRECVEVSGEEMEAVLVAGDACKQRAQLDHAMPLGPRGVKRTQMDAEDPQFVGSGIDLEKRVPRQSRMMPFEMAHRPLRLMKASDSPRDEAHCAMPVRAAIFSTTAGIVASWKTVMSGLIGGDHRGNLILLACAAAADVVGQNAQRHVTSGLGFIDEHADTAGRSSSPRKYMTTSRDA